ncbi:MAG: DUF3048 domain-containing protein [Actinomycetota bacterium]
MSLLARRVALLLALALLAAACGGGGDSDDGAAETTEAPAEATSETTEAPATTEVVDTTTSEAAAADLGPVLPLTGLPGEADRPALAIKIDNHPQNARPQVGLNQADLVMEEVVEGNITRFIVVFHSQDSDPVGPVRSARTQDVVLLAHLGTPLFANSGGNAGTMSAVRSSEDLVNANVDAIPSAFYREGRPRFAPHNLFSNTSDIYAGVGEDGLSGRPPQLFTYLGADDELPASATAATGVDLAYGGINVSYAWDESADGWARMQSGTPHVDGDDVLVAPTNVVVMETEYGRSAADPGSPEARVTGTGRAWVFTQGTVQVGTWEREAPQDVATLTSDSGEPMVLTPGTTWIGLPRPGGATVVG